MKITSKQLVRYMFSALLLVALQCFTTPAVADVRQDAGAAVSVLQQNSAAQKFPEDLKNIDEVFDTALRYLAVGEQERADHYFMLTLQKAQLLEQKIAALEVPAVPEEELPVDTPDPAAESADVKTPVRHFGRMIGSKGVYTVEKGDTVRLISAKLGVTQRHLRRMNHLDDKVMLKVGQKLAYDNRKIVPQQVRDGIIVNIPDRTLYYFQQGALVASLPVALGSVMKNEKYVWQTPLGKFKITAKLKDPTWTVPTSIRTEMEEQGKEVINSIAPGPENPLGKYALRTSLPGILIHSTTKPGSIYSFSSHGCIRVSPSMMEGFFPQIKVNTRGEIIYKPVKLAVTDDGRVFLEVHDDVYSKSTDLAAEARQLVEKRKLSELVDWEKFNTVVHQKRGVVEDISL